MFRTIIVLLAACASGPALAASCSITPFNGLPGSESSAQMVVHTGSVCGVQMTVRGGGMRMSIGQQAANGTATAPTETSFAYVSHPGFVGRDRFEADFTGELMSNGRGPSFHGTSRILVDVDVVR